MSESLSLSVAKSDGRDAIRKRCPDGVKSGSWEYSALYLYGRDANSSDLAIREGFRHSITVCGVCRGKAAEQLTRARKREEIERAKDKERIEKRAREERTREAENEAKEQEKIVENNKADQSFWSGDEANITDTSENASDDFWSGEESKTPMAVESARENNYWAGKKDTVDSSSSNNDFWSQASTKKDAAKYSIDNGNKQKEESADCSTQSDYNSCIAKACSHIKPPVKWMDELTMGNFILRRAGMGEDEFDSEYLDKKDMCRLKNQKQCCSSGPQWYAIISWSSNPNLEEFDCKIDRQSRIVSTPILVPDTHQGIKHSLTYQFLDWAYKKDKSSLDKVAGHTKVHFKSIVLAQTIEEVKRKASRQGFYDTDSKMCLAQGNDKVDVKILGGFKYRDGNLESIIGGANRKTFLGSYFNHKN